MDAGYVARYRELYDRHWWWRAREEVVASILARLDARRGGRGFGPILDVGCGDGLFFPVLRRFGEPEGVEPEADAVSDEGRRRGAIHVVPFDAGFAPGRRFGLVLFLDVLEHLDDDVAALARARELLAGGGLVLVTVPAFHALWTTHDDLNLHRRRYTRATLVRVARAAGLEPVAGAPLRYFFHWVFFAKLATRVAERLRRAEPAVPGIPAEPWNRGLTALSRLEERLLRPLGLPFGGSLLAVLAPPGSR